jgi:hypothetical protein
MSSLPDIERLLREIWPNEPVALEVLRAVTALRLDDIDYITVPLLVQLIDHLRGEPLHQHAGDKAMIDAVYKWTELFASELVGLLDPHFELLRDDDKSVLLEPATIAHALRTGVLYDPDSGAVVDDWMAHVVPFYSATSALREILHERA